MVMFGWLGITRVGNPGMIATWPLLGVRWEVVIHVNDSIHINGYVWLVGLGVMIIVLVMYG